MKCRDGEKLTGLNDQAGFAIGSLLSMSLSTSLSDQIKDRQINAA
jgi:hypothetical protein